MIACYIEDGGLPPAQMKSIGCHLPYPPHPLRQLLLHPPQPFYLTYYCLSFSFSWYGLHYLRRSAPEPMVCIRTQILGVGGPDIEPLAAAGRWVPYLADGICTVQLRGRGLLYQGTVRQVDSHLGMR